MQLLSFFSEYKNVGRFSSYIGNSQVLHSVGKICKLEGEGRKGWEICKTGL